MASGEWLEKALQEVCGKISGIDLDADLISGLVSFCELAPPPDAADYITNIIGLEAGEEIIREYLQRRGYVDSQKRVPDVQTSKSPYYTKPPADEGPTLAARKQPKKPKEATPSTIDNTKNVTESVESRNITTGVPKKKKGGKTVSLAEVAKGSVVFKQGKPCSCQARQHRLVNNCLSCGKIVCEQEGEGPCSFCGALVLTEGSTYAGLDDVALPLSDAEAAAGAFTKRLVEYDRNSAERTKVIDDQSDYYEFEGNSWLSPKEKELLQKKQEEVEKAAKAQRDQVVVTFDLLGRKVVMSKDDASELESEHRILRPPEERESNRIKANPTVMIQPVFVSTGPSRKMARGKEKKPVGNGLCLEVSGRVQYDGRINGVSSGDETQWQAPAAASRTAGGDSYECFLDYDSVA